MNPPWGFRFGRTESTQSYMGVLVPLEQAHAYSHSARQGKAEYDAPEHEMEELRSGTKEHEGSGDEEDEIDGLDEEEEGMLKKHVSEYSIEGLRAEMRKGSKTGETWTSYEIKSKLLNKAIQDIGMGRYNWQLFILCGFGWFADNLWLQGVSLCLPSFSGEFDVSEKSVRYTTSAVFLGLSAGSFVWGIGSDWFGRRIAFNSTLLIASVFGIAAAYMPSWGTACFFLAAMGFGVGGSLPVDGALFLEFLPDASSALLTLLSVWWPVGQLVSSLAAWYFIANWPVEEGWRYFVVTIGVVTFAMFVCRFFVFYLFESPKWLLNQGRQSEAVAVIHGIAYKNNTKTWLTDEIMDLVAGEDDETVQPPQPLAAKVGSNALKAKLKGFSGDRLRPLFTPKKLGIATGLIWYCWASIGMGYPLFAAFLPQYFAHVSEEADPSGVQDETSVISTTTYRNYAITSIIGVPGSLLAAWLVDRPSPFLGRRGTLATSTFFSALFTFAFVLWGTTPNRQLAFSCVGAFAQNIMYGVLYAFTPEIFPAPARGTGTGVASFLNRITGLAAPILAANIPGDGATTPIYISSILILSSFVAMCCIPIETRGAQIL